MQLGLWIKRTGMLSPAQKSCLAACWQEKHCLLYFMERWVSENELRPF